MPTIKPKPGRKPGRPVGTGYKPTTAHRKLVEQMATFGIREDRMVILIINPMTKKPISKTTLLEHFRDELDRGLVKAQVTGARNLLRLTETHPAAAIFFAKCRLGYRETVDVEVPPSDGKTPEETNMRDLGRRIAFTLAMGVRQKETT